MRMVLAVLGTLFMIGCTGPTTLVDWFGDNNQAILVRSKDLTPEEVQDLSTKIKIAQIINLRTDPYPQEKVQALEGMQVKVHHLPMHHKDSADKLYRDVDRFLEIMDEARDNPELCAVLVHCQSGLHRTGLIVAVYRMEYEGWTHSEAYAEMVGQPYYNVTIHNIESLREFVKKYVRREDR